MSSLTSPTSVAGSAAAGSGESLAAKKKRMELFAAVSGAASVKTEADIKEAFQEATANHPFVDQAHYSATLDSTSVFCDSNGKMCGMLIKKALPPPVAKRAADVLRPAATRTSLRAAVFGGESPHSGIAGYYDYNGSPITYKCRKTSFTCEVINTWKDVFPMVQYCSELYKAACPSNWSAQHAAVPDVVRLCDTPFSTLTINQRFRTAQHTDAGDFDEGYGLLTVLEGNYEGLNLGLPKFGVNFRMAPGDLLIFNTHHYHCNTELEKMINELSANPMGWDRLTCVLYYRATLGESNCMANYRRRLTEAKAANRAVKFDTVPDTKNGENYNRPAAVNRGPVTPSLVGLAAVRSTSGAASRADVLRRLHQALAGTSHESQALQLALFGELLRHDPKTGLPLRSQSEVVPLLDQAKSIIGAARELGASRLGGFSEGTRLDSNRKERQGHFTDQSLRESLNPELFDMWIAAKKDWLEAVAADWEKMIQRNPDRDAFTWANKGTVNSSFFELCDVASEVMLQLLGKEEATPAEAAAFWLGFAGHLFEECQTVNSMPNTAMSLRKLNVKLKDFNFGGTRYFKDQSPEEQKRRLERKARIAAARKGVGQKRRRRDSDDDGSDSEGDPTVTSSWLDNDAFDYQEETTTIDYAALGLATPEMNASSLIPRPWEQHFSAAAKPDVVTPTMINVMVVVPDNLSEAAAEKRDLAALRAMCEALGLNADEQQHAHEQQIGRILGTKAVRDAFASLAGEDNRAATPTTHEVVQLLESVARCSAENATEKSIMFSDAQLTVRVMTKSLSAFMADTHESAQPDVVVLRHVVGAGSLAANDDEIVAKAAALNPCAVLLAGTDRLDRNRFFLDPAVSDAHDRVAPVAYTMAHALLQASRDLALGSLPRGIPSLPQLKHVASSSSLEVAGEFVFKYSPLNTVCVVAVEK